MPKKKKRRVLFWAILIVLAAAAGCFFFVRNPAKAPTRPESFLDNQEAPSSFPADGKTPAAEDGKPALPVKKIPESSPAPGNRGVYSAGEGDASGPDFAIEAVDYDGSVFSPASITIKSGDYIFFRNKGKLDFWPAAASAASYPDFVAAGAVAPGKSFKFQFNRAGKWQYLDKLNPSATGIVIVETK